jgi:ferritin
MSRALNKQVNEEINSAYIYAAMSADFAARNLDGFAAWMDKQAREELGHAAKIKSFLYDRNGRIYLDTLQAPQGEWKSPKDAMQAALKHEQYISQCILDLVKTAREENDTPTEVFLGWFVSEQVEEEDSVQSVLDKLEMIGDNPVGLYNLDREMGMRS